MRKRIIFLDIDGPVIPSGMFLVDKDASANRTFSLSAIAVLRHILKVTGAKLVTNSSHNTYGRKGFSLQDDLLSAGIPHDVFHDTWRTEYPNDHENGGIRDRMEAIDHWINQNDDGHGVDWLAFDDYRFTMDPRLILIDFDVGLTPKDLDRVRDAWPDVKRTILI